MLTNVALCFTITLRILEMTLPDARNKISFHALQKPLQLKKRKHLKQFLSQIFKSEKKRLNSLNVIFCSYEYLLKINKEYLKHDTFTDILTFDLSGDLPGVRGDIYISLDRIKENAFKYDTTVSIELHRVIFHGILHLCGY